MWLPAQVRRNGLASVSVVPFERALGGAVVQIQILNVRDEVNVLTVARLNGEMVRVLHDGEPVADIPSVDLALHLSPWRHRLWQRQRRWQTLNITVTARNKVVISIRGKVDANTLTEDELSRLRGLVRTPSAAPPKRRGWVTRQQ